MLSNIHCLVLSFPPLTFNIATCTPSTNLYNLLLLYHSSMCYTVVTSSTNSILVSPFLKSIAFDDQRSLQDDPSFFVSLIVLCGKLIHPTQLLLAVLAENIPHHVSAGDHHTVLYLTVREVDYFIEEIRPPRWAGESCGYELWTVCEIGVAMSTGEQSAATHVIQEFPTHYQWATRQIVKHVNNIKNLNSGLIIIKENIHFSYRDWEIIDQNRI